MRSSPSHLTSDQALIQNLKCQLKDKDKHISQLEKQLHASDSTIKVLQENEIKLKYAEKFARIQLSSSQTSAKRTSIHLQQSTELVSKLTKGEESRLRISLLQREEVEAELNAAEETLQQTKDDYEKKLSDAEELRRQDLTDQESRMFAEFESKFKDFNDGYQTQLAEAKKENEGLQDRLDTVEKDFAKVAGEVEESRRYATTLMNRVNAAETEAKNSVRAKDKEMSRMSGELEESRRISQRVHERVDFLEAEHLVLEAKLEASADELAKANEEIKKLQGDVQGKCDDIAEGQRFAETLQDKIRQLESQKRELDIRAQESMEALSIAVKSSGQLKVDIEEKAGSVEDLRNARQSLEQKLHALETEVTVLQGRVRAGDENILIAEEGTYRLREELAASIANTEKLQASQDILVTEKTNIEEKLQQALLTLNDCETKISVLSSELEVRAVEVEEATAEHAILLKRIEESDIAKNVVEEALKGEKADLANAIQRIEELRSVVESEALALEAADNQRLSYEERIQILELSESELKETLDSYINISATSEGAASELRDSLNSKISQLQEAQQKIQRLQESFDKLEKDIIPIKDGEKNQLELKLLESNRTYAQLENQLNNVVYEKENIDNELQNVKACLKSSENLVTQLKAQVQEVSKELRDVNIGKDRATALLVECEKNLARANEDLEDTRRSSLELHERMYGMGSETSTLQINLFETTEKLREKEKELARATEDLNQSRASADSLRGDFTSLQADNNRMKVSLGDMSSELDSLNKQIVLLKNELSEKIRTHNESEVAHTTAYEELRKSSESTTGDINSELSRVKEDLLMALEHKQILEADLVSTGDLLKGSEENSLRLTQILEASIKRSEEKERELQVAIASIQDEKVAAEESLRKEMKYELDNVAEALKAMKEEYEKKLHDTEAAQVAELEQVRIDTESLLQSEADARNDLHRELDEVIALLQLSKDDYENQIAEIKSAFELQEAAYKERIFSLQEDDEPEPHPSMEEFTPAKELKIRESIKLSPRFRYMSERDALVSLYDSAVGVKWIRRDNWDSSKPLSEWYGVSVDDDGHVKKIDLRSNNLIGSIPFGIGNLLYLEELYLNGNNLSGSIPEAVGYIVSLEIVNLADNKFSGSIPDLVGTPNLKHLILSRNGLQGSVPNMFEKLSSLEILALENNKLTMSIPTSIKALTQLKELRLNDNNFSGPLCSGFASLAQIECIDISNNQLSGPIEEIVFSDKLALRELLLFNNKLSGSLPLSLFSLTSLVVLNMERNKFSGSIHGSINNLTSLLILNLSQNELSGPLPDSLCALTSLKEIHLNINKLSGVIPEDIGKLSSLEKLVLSGNSLKGRIPESITTLITLKSLFLSKNQLSGSIPQSIGNLINLEHLHLNSNLLNGPLPVSVANIENLRQLYVNDNKLSGGSFGSMLFGLSKSKVQAVLPKCVINV